MKGYNSRQKPKSFLYIFYHFSVFFCLCFPLTSALPLLSLYTVYYIRYLFGIRVCNIQPFVCTQEYRREMNKPIFFCFLSDGCLHRMYRWMNIYFRVVGETFSVRKSCAFRLDENGNEIFHHPFYYSFLVYSRSAGADGRKIVNRVLVLLFAFSICFFRIEKTFRMEIIFVGVQCIDHVKNGNEWVVDWGSTPSTWTTLWSSCSMIYHNATVDWIRTSDALIASVGHWEASIDEQTKKKHKKQSCSSNIICSNILVTYFEWTAHP